MSLTQEHRELVAEKIELRKRIVRERTTLDRVIARMSELQAAGDMKSEEWAKARAKRRHIEDRLEEAAVDLVSVEGKIEQLQFRADFG